MFALTGRTLSFVIYFDSFFGDPSWPLTYINPSWARVFIRTRFPFTTVAACATRTVTWNRNGPVRCTLLHYRTTFGVMIHNYCRGIVSTVEGPN